MQVRGRLRRGPVSDLTRSLDWAVCVYGGVEGELQQHLAHTKKKCGYIFKTGDIAWLCRTCQADDTCVLCSECFNDSDHTGHEVFFHRTRAGGICDCGDPEAWRNDGCCSRHRSDRNNEAVCPTADAGADKALPTQLMAALNTAVGEVLLFINCYRAATESSFGPEGRAEMYELEPVRPDTRHCWSEKAGRGGFS